MHPLSAQSGKTLSRAWVGAVRRKESVLLTEASRPEFPNLLTLQMEQVHLPRGGLILPSGTQRRSDGSSLCWDSLIHFNSE